MKLEFLLFCLILININCEVVSSCEGDTEKDCTGKTNSDNETCCFVEVEYKKEWDEDGSKTNVYKDCEGLDKYDIDHIKDLIKIRKSSDNYDAKKEDKDDKVKKYSIKCQSTFLKFGFIGLIAALLL